MVQAFGNPQTENAKCNSASVFGLSLDASGDSLAQGMQALGDFIRGLVLEGSS